jgi:hypothetical protein
LRGERRWVHMRIEDKPLEEKPVEDKPMIEDKPA